MNKRTILVGPTASGKNYLRDKYLKRGYSLDVSYTTRESRLGEKAGVDYKFVSETQFVRMIENNDFYEHVEYNGNRYGTSMDSWENNDIFIMEPHGVSLISEEDRKSCFIIYINPKLQTREQRMVRTRGWSSEQVIERNKTDNFKFQNFNDFDIEITSDSF